MSAEDTEGKDMKSKIDLAREVRKHITTHIADVWPGFTPFPFIIYDDKEQVAVGAKWPERYLQVEKDIWVAAGLDSQLFANTSVMYHGVKTAIWDARTWPDGIGIAQAAADVTHEMFHAFQSEVMADLPPANELLLPVYPHTAMSVALVIEENKLLAEICASPDAATVNKCLCRIASLRKQREAEVGADYIEIDKCCETGEGTAVYAEVCMKAIINESSVLDAADFCLPFLTDDKILSHYRHRCYVVGLVLCLASDIMWPGWHTMWAASGKTLFDWMSDKLAHVESDESISAAYLKTADELLAAHQSGKEQKIAEFMAQPHTVIEGDVKLMIFDPMNIVCNNGRCLHKHGKLRIDGEEQMLTTPFLAEYGGTIFDIKRIFIPN